MAYTPKNPNGQATMANSSPVVVASDQSKIKVDLTETTANAVAIKVDNSAVTQPVSGTVTANAGTGTFTVDGSGVTQPVSAASLPLPTGASTSAKQPALGTAGTASSDVLTVQGIASMTALKTDGSATTQPVSGTVTADQGGTWTVQPGNTANTTAWLVTNQNYSTSTVTSVAASATSVQLLASTSGRKAAYFYNDSTADCYLKLGTTASTSSFTVKMVSNSFYELPQPCYTGRIDAIWSSATGNIRITEIT